MINFTLLSKITNRYNSKVMPFLFELKEKVSINKPYKGLRVLHNLPLTVITLMKIEALLLGGANVTVSPLQGIDIQREAFEVLQKCGVKIFLEPPATGKFDIHLDCCAQLVKLPKPHIGSAELTQTGSYIYKALKTTYPVISVDDSNLKRLETIGTGEAFVTALQQMTNIDITHKKYILFGCGKVGAGILKALQKITKNIVIVERNHNKIKSLDDRGVLALHYTEKKSIIAHLKDAFCCVTATGTASVISKNFKKEVFANVHLANMGILDEYGDEFSEHEVLFEKKPINFCLSEPTPPQYLDPIFYAHNICIDLLINNKMNVAYNKFPKELSSQILKKWVNLHHENIEEHILI
jgi:adenosylhomocysteinase